MVEEPSPETQKRHPGVRKFNRLLLNRITKLFAGHFLYSLVLHTGRRSGAAYTTPVLAAKEGASIYIPLPYGADTDWYLNVAAAGKGKLKMNGELFFICSPEIVNAATALPAFSPVIQKALSRAKINQFTRMQISTVESTGLERSI